MRFKYICRYFEDQEHDQEIYFSQAISRRHNNELKILKETTDLELEAWKNNYRKQQTSQLVEKEARMREQFKKERDRDIEDVIDRLETEATEARQQIEQTAETRIRKVDGKLLPGFNSHRISDGFQTHADQVR